MNLSLALYAFVRGAIAGFCRIFWRVRVEGGENIPATGAFVLSPVHRSNVDTLLAACVTRRPMHFMGKDTMWKYKPFGAFFTALGGFPVTRGTADREAMRRCLEELEKGEPVVMFPEGTRQSGPIIESIFDGPAYVAAKARCPIVPVGFGGAEAAMPKGAKFLRPVKVTVIVGSPIPPPEITAGGRVSRSSVRDTTAALQSALQRLFDTAQARAGR